MPRVSACFLPVFYLVRDRLIACTGWFQQIPVDWGLQLEVAGRPPRNASRARSNVVLPWPAAPADRTVAAKAAAAYCWCTRATMVGGPPARWRSPRLIADSRQ